jgi:hypothetical protein
LRGMCQAAGYQHNWHVAKAIKAGSFWEVVAKFSGTYAGECG